MRRIVACSIMVFFFILGISIQGNSDQFSKVRSVPDAKSPLLEPGKVVVKLRPHVVAKGMERFKVTGMASFDAKLDRFSVQEVRKRFQHRPIPEGSGLPDLSRIYTLSFPQHFDPEAVAREFAKDPNVEYAEPISVPLIEETPDDPMFGQQTFMSRIRAAQAWDVQHGSSAVVIAIVDNGPDWQHPDLNENIWQNLGEDADGDGHTMEWSDGAWVLDPGDLNGVDDDDWDDDPETYVDDLIGYDLAEGDNNPTHPTPDAQGYYDHGTLTSGLAAAVTNNGTGVAGVSWNCRVMAIKCSYDDSPRYVSFGYEGIIYAAENGADVISCSWGSFGSFSQANQDVIDYVYGLGSIVVASGGNTDTGDLHYPSAYVNVLSAGWINNQDRREATYGISIDVCAPGTQTLTTMPVVGGSYGSADGSSMSCPIVAGLCGLVKSQHPGWSNDDIVRQVALTADNIDAQNPGFEGLLGSGRVNAYNAVTATVLTEVPPKIFSFNITQNDDVNGDGDGLFERGETINVNAQYRNYSLGTASNFEVSMETDDPDLTIVDGNSFVGTFSPDAFQTTSDPLAFSIAPDANPHMAQLVLSYTADGGIGGADTFAVIIGKMPVLLVDDDDGQNNVEGYYTNIFDDLGVLYAVWDHASLGSPTPFILSNFPIVIWACEWTFPSLDLDDMAAVEDYLNNGGNLFISGQDIAWEFNEGSLSGYVDFFETYFHAVYYADNSGVQSIDGIVGDEIGDGLSFDVYQPGWDADQQFPEEIEPGPGASAVFEYTGGLHHKAGIKYQGDHRVIYFGFGFEAIDATAVLDPSQPSAVRTEVMTRVLNWVNFIRHDPLKDSEDVNSSYPVEVTVTGDISDLAEVTLFWKKETSPSFTQVVMSHQGDGVYTGTIPPAGSETTIQYYVTTENPYYGWQSPMGAPTGVYSFQVRPDVTDPQFLRIDQLTDTYRRSGTSEVTAKVTDNLGIGEVSLFYQLNDEPFTEVAMTPTGIPDEYGATLEWSGDFGDVVNYYVEAVDASSNHNTATSAEYSFDIVPYLLLDDFETGTSDWDLGTGWGLGGFGVDNSTSIVDSPQGNYEDNEDNSLTYLETFDFSSCTEAALTFWHFYSFEDGNDFGYVEASADGESWTALESFTGFDGYPVKKRCTLLEGFCGPGNEEVSLRFRVVSDESGAADGWTVDDIMIWSKVVRGDVNCDGSIDIIDVLGAVNVVLGVETSSYALWAADFTEDGGVDIIDAIGIVNRILNPKGVIPEGQASARVEIRYAPITSDTRGECAISVQADVPIGGAQFNLVAEQGIGVGEALLSRRSAGMTVASNRKGNGTVFVVYSADGQTIAPGDDPIVTVPYDITSESREVLLDGLILVDVNGREFQIEEMKTSSDPEDGLVPQEFSLAQNYPNPFNPTTSVQYSVVGGQPTPHISLKIYNILGQEVRTLVNEHKEPGYYTVTWDGRDGLGNDVSSGIYFYRLSVDSGRWSAAKSMVFMK